MMETIAGVTMSWPVPDLEWWVMPFTAKEVRANELARKIHDGDDLVSKFLRTHYLSDGPTESQPFPVSSAGEPLLYICGNCRTHAHTQPCRFTPESLVDDLNRVLYGPLTLPSENHRGCQGIDRERDRVALNCLILEKQYGVSLRKDHQRDYFAAKLCGSWPKMHPFQEFHHSETALRLYERFARLHDDVTGERILNFCRKYGLPHWPSSDYIRFEPEFVEEFPVEGERLWAVYSLGTIRHLAQHLDVARSVVAGSKNEEGVTGAVASWYARAARWTPSRIELQMFRARPDALQCTDCPETLLIYTDISCDSNEHTHDPDTLCRTSGIDLINTGLYLKVATMPATKSEPVESDTVLDGSDTSFIAQAAIGAFRCSQHVLSLGQADDDDEDQCQMREACLKAIGILVECARQCPSADAHDGISIGIHTAARRLHPTALDVFASGRDSTLGRQLLWGLLQPILRHYLLASRAYTCQPLALDLVNRTPPDARLVTACHSLVVVVHKLALLTAWVTAVALPEHKEKAKAYLDKWLDQTPIYASGDMVVVGDAAALEEVPMTELPPIYVALLERLQANTYPALPTAERGIEHVFCVYEQLLNAAWNSSDREAMCALPVSMGDHLLLMAKLWTYWRQIIEWESQPLPEGNEQARIHQYLALYRMLDAQLQHAQNETPGVKAPNASDALSLPDRIWSAWKRLHPFPLHTVQDTEDLVTRCLEQLLTGKMKSTACPEPTCYTSLFDAMMGLLIVDLHGGGRWVRCKNPECKGFFFARHGKLAYCPPAPEVGDPGCQQRAEDARRRLRKARAKAGG